MCLCLFVNWWWKGKKLEKSVVDCVRSTVEAICDDQPTDYCQNVLLWSLSTNSRTRIMSSVLVVAVVHSRGLKWEWNKVKSKQINQWIKSQQKKKIVKPAAQKHRNDKREV